MFFIALVTAAILSLVLAARGSWWGPAVPAGAIIGGSIWFLSAPGETESGAHLAGGGLAIVGGPWLLVILIVMFVSRAVGARPTPSQRAGRG